MRFQDDTYWEDELRIMANRKEYEDETQVIRNILMEVTDKLEIIVNMQMQRNDKRQASSIRQKTVFYLEE